MFDYNSIEVLKDLKVLFFGIFFINLYFRKKIKAFLNIAIASFCYFATALTILNGHNSYKLILLAVVLAFAFFISLKELLSYHHKGLYARDIINADKIDLLVFILLIIVWNIIKIIIQR